MQNGKRVSNNFSSLAAAFTIRSVSSEPIFNLYAEQFLFDFVNDSKPSGLRAGRKLVNHRRHERWSSKQYNKSHSVTAMKANPLGGSCMSKGIVLEKM